MHPLKSFLRECAVFLFLAVLTALASLPFKASLQAAAAREKDRLAGRIEAAAGKTLAYTSAGLSVFNTLDLRGVTLSGGNGQIPDIEVSRIRIPYSAGRLLSGHGFDAVKKIIIEKPVIRWRSGISEEKDGAEKEDGTEGGGAPARPAGAAKEKAQKTYSEIYALISPYIPEGSAFELVIRGGAVFAETPALKLNAQKISFKLIHSKILRLDGKMNISAEIAGKDSKKPFMFNSAAHVSLSFTPQDAAFNVSVRNFQSSAVNVSKMNILFTLNDRFFTAQKINDRRPFDLLVSYNLAGQTCKVSFIADNFMPSAIASLQGAYKKNAWALRTAISGTLDIESGSLFTDGALSKSLKNIPVSYKVELNAALTEKSPLGKSRISLSASGTQKHIAIRNAAFRARDSAVIYKGTAAFDPFIPNGTLEIQNFKFKPEGGAAINTVFSISGWRQNITVFADSLMLGDVELQGVNASFIHTGSGYNWTASALRFIANEEDVHISNIDAAGALDVSGKNLDASITMNSVALVDIFGIMNLAVDMKGIEKNALAGNVYFTTEVFFNTDFKHFSYNIPSFVAALKGERSGFAVLSASGTDQFFELSSGRFVWKDGGMDLLARANFADQNDISFSIDCSLKNISYYINGSILDKSNIRVTGSYGLEILASAQKNGFSGFMKLEMFPLPIGKGVSSFTFDSDFRYAGASLWSVNINRMEIQGGGTFLASNTLLLSGFINQDGLSFPDIYFNKSDGALYGDAQFAWNLYDEEKRVAGRLSLNNAALSERFVIDCRYAAGEVTIRGDALNFQSNWIYEGSVNSSLSGAFVFNARNKEWQSTFEVYALTMNISGGTVRLSTRGSLNNQLFQLEETTVSYNAVQTRFSYLSVDLESHVLNTSVNADGYLGKRLLRFDAALSFEFGKAESWTQFRKMTEHISGGIVFQNFIYDRIAVNKPFTFNFLKNGPVLSASGGPENMLSSRIDSEGSLFLSLSKPSPVRGAILGSLKDGEIDIAGSGLYIDMASIWEFVPLDVIDFTDGIVSADLRIQGPAADPSFYGSANGNHVCLRLPSYVNGTIGPAPVTLTFQGAEMILEELTAPAGSGEARISGLFQFDRWIPRTFKLNIDAEEEMPVPFEIDVAGINAKGDASGHLEIILDENSISILSPGSDIQNKDRVLVAHNAEITLDSGQFWGQNREQQASAEPEEDVEVVAALTIQTGRKVEFLWPNRDLPILRATASAGDTISITSNSLAGVFALKGDVRLRSGEMYYFQRSFYLRSGSLTFNETETQFDPRLSVRAEMRDRTADGAVTISMIVDNQSLLSFSPRLESTPALSQVEILSILGGNLSGLSEGASDTQNITPFISSGIDFAAQFFGLRRFENFIRDKVLHVDMFSARTQALQNILMVNQRDSTQTDSNAEAAPRAGNFFDNTSIFIGKYFGADMFGQLMLNMRYDENRLEFSGLTLEPEFALEFTTPLFDIEWHLAVDNFEDLWTNPRTIKGLWIPNNSISIVKHWTLP